MTITNTLARSSCSKCVEVLQELVSGLQQQQLDAVDSDRRKISNEELSSSSSAPLSLLKAIARSSHQQRQRYDRWGQLRKPPLPQSSSSSQHQNPRRRNRDHYLQAEANVNPNNNSLLKVEEVEDGVRLTIPVETTEPTNMQRWSRLRQPYDYDYDDDDYYNKTIRDDGSGVFVQPALATSVRRSSNNNHHIHGEELSDINSSKQQQEQRPIEKPLTIELYCRKCSTKGPEAGARAFLMGPEPLSIVLCHNRIDSNRDEIEEILTHELIHLYDVQTLQLDLTDCETVAYSEIRAAREAECSKYMPAQMRQPSPSSSPRSSPPVHHNYHDKNTNKRDPNNDDIENEQDESNYNKSNPSSSSSSSLMKHVVPNIISEKWNKAQQSYCVQNIALGAVQNMFPRRGKGKRCLNQVWTKAFNDHRPFHNERMPYQKNHNHDTTTRTSKDEEERRNVSKKSSGTSHGTSGK